MIYAVVSAASGALVSTTDRAELVASAESLTAEGFELVTLDITAFEAGGAWDAAARTFLLRDPEQEPS